MAVVGSANTDYVSRVRRRPADGETLVADSFEIVPGGKGLNQALAAARITSTALIAAIGRDRRGEVLLRQAASAGLNVEHVQRVSGATGRAFITVEHDGSNSIVVAAGAGSELNADAATAALAELDPLVVLCQLEIDLATAAACARWARESGARFVLNCSPVRDVPSEVVEIADPIIVNAEEARSVLRSSEADCAALAAQLADLAVSAIVTSGRDGAFGCFDGRSLHSPGRPALVVDTTGAGDAFAGTVAAELGRGELAIEAMDRANAVAAAVVAEARQDRRAGTA